MLAIVDSGGANIGSVKVALARLGVVAGLTADPKSIRAAERVILPGVGAAGAAMAKLRHNGLDRLIPTLSQPVLGICLGMQLLYQSSEEDDVECIGVFSGQARRMQGAEQVRIPHMGWNRLQIQTKHRLLEGLPEPAWMYFVHSYAIPIEATTVATCTHGTPFTAVAAKDNFMVAQFHPERSAAAGNRLLENFLRMPI